MAEYSYLVLYLPRGTSRDAARRILTDHAEYGNWELSGLRLYPDGSRRATLRRLVIRQARTQLGIQWRAAGRNLPHYTASMADQAWRESRSTGGRAGC